LRNKSQFWVVFNLGRTDSGEARGHDAGHDAVDTELRGLQHDRGTTRAQLGSAGLGHGSDD
jgi:hypothetical protein